MLQRPRRRAIGEFRQGPGSLQVTVPNVQPAGWATRALQQEVDTARDAVVHLVADRGLVGHLWNETILHGLGH